MVMCSPKAFQKSLDASYAFSKPDNSFRCITRKVSRVNDGRRILQDLNNSALDFVQMIPNPKAFAPSKLTPHYKLSACLLLLYRQAENCL